MTAHRPAGEARPRWTVRKLLLGGWLVHCPNPADPDDTVNVEVFAEVEQEGTARELVRLLNHEGGIP